MANYDGHDPGADATVRRPRIKAAAKPTRRTGGRSEIATKTVNLALQGGGSHGAFAWGVLDRLLEDGRIKIEGISATSAGASSSLAPKSAPNLPSRRPRKTKRAKLHPASSKRPTIPCACICARWAPFRC